MRFRLRIRSFMVVVALAAIALTVPAAIRDRRLLARLDEVKSNMHNQIQRQEYMRPLPHPNREYVLDQQRIQWMQKFREYKCPRSWAEEDALFDREILGLRTQIREVERRQNEIRARWALPSSHEVGR